RLGRTVALKVLRSDDPERRNPDLVAALVGAGARIVSVSEEEVSLEDVYLRLVDEEDRKLREEGAA
ncbi:MAG: hypothetical protein ACK2UL_09125, partial [Anaerolineae bacterium]